MVFVGPVRTVGVLPPDGYVRPWVRAASEAKADSRKIWARTVHECASSGTGGAREVAGGQCAVAVEGVSPEELSP